MYGLQRLKITNQVVYHQGDPKLISQLAASDIRFRL